MCLCLAYVTAWTSVLTPPSVDSGDNMSWCPLYTSARKFLWRIADMPVSLLTQGRNHG